MTLGPLPFPGAHHSASARRHVCEQQAEARDRKSRSGKDPLSPEQIAKQRQEQSLRLSRSRIIQQLGAAQNPIYRKTLENALADLDRKLASQDDSKV